MKGRPIDYSLVDWSLSNTEIAILLNTNKSVVRRKRLKLGLTSPLKQGQCNNRYIGSKRKPINDIDYEFAWKKKGNNSKGGGKAWHNAVIRYYGNACVSCGYNHPKIPNDCHHIIPISKGGKNTIKNGIVLCSRCHKEEHVNI